MARLLYQVLLWLALPAVLIRLEWRARREPEYGERIGERLGRVPTEVPPGCIWFHAVSAGETIAAAPLIAALAREFSEEGSVPFLVTAMTPAGLAQAASLLGGAVHHCYAPYDFPFAVRAFFDRVRPKLLVLVGNRVVAEPNRRSAAAGRARATGQCTPLGAVGSRLCADAGIDGQDVGADWFCRLPIRR